jgi:uncharacterized protein (DUF433 family)
MKMDRKHPRITMIPGLCGGRPTIRGMRMRVCDVLGYLAGGNTPETLLEDFPYLELEDITAALDFAADVLEDTTLDNLPKPRPEYLGKKTILSI